MLICPNCHNPINKLKNTFECSNHHSFDISKKGYVNLTLPKDKPSGDNKQMVLARRNFLNNNYFYPLVKEIIKIILELNKKNTNNQNIILDAGCGDGYYIKMIANSLQYQSEQFIGFDISKEAIRQASKASNLFFFVASGANIPIQDKSIDIILNIFAPFFDSEFYRVLKEESYVIKVIPGESHLLELKSAIYENPYLNTEKIPSSSFLEMIRKDHLEFKFSVNQDDIQNLVKMTPYFYKTSLQDIEKVKDFLFLDITASFSIIIYKKIKTL